MHKLAKTPAIVPPGTNPPGTAASILRRGNTPGAAAGRQRVFTGEWLTGGCGCHIYREGYAGYLISRWNGWAVFNVTLSVAQAIVAAHQDTQQQIMTEAISRGADLSGAWLETLTHMPSVTWTANMIVVDNRTGFADPTMVEISAPDSSGYYTIGWGWDWGDTDPANVHTIHRSGQ